jgi:hypothetical protein
MNSSSFTRPGDFLIVRTGFAKQYAALPIHEQLVVPFRDNATFLGVETAEKTLPWFWEKKLALVGADNVGFEAFPQTGSSVRDKRSLHEVFISGWGQSIGELV